jgi:hypothetical protein
MRPKREKGSSILEFALVGTFLLLPLVLGTATLGLSILESIHAVELNRDAAHMFARGVDFSQAANRSLLLELANGLDITDSGGQGVETVSTPYKIKFGRVTLGTPRVVEIDGLAGGQAVCARRLVIGNAALRASNFATPAKFTDSQGDVDITDPSAQANSFLNVLPMSAGDKAYVAETYFQGFNWLGLAPNTGMYTRSIF